MGARVIAALKSLADRVLGRGEATITVPTFDGALKPNQALDTAEIVYQGEALEDLATDGARLILADGASLVRLGGEASEVLKTFERPISAIAMRPDGAIAVALTGREVRVFASPTDGQASAVFSDPGMRAVNALAPTASGAWLATDGSSERDADGWARDLLEQGRGGRVLRLGPGGGDVKVIASGLRYAFGAYPSRDEAWVSESWRHRVVAIGGDGSRRVVVDNLPVYPSRLSPAAGGGFWLTAFAARTQLIEFVLREPAFRKRMIAEVPPEYWIAPRLRSGVSFMEPMQGAHLKMMGVVKPWAPPRSYGLVIRLSAEGAPLYSLHSRVDGVNHGIVSAVEWGDHLYLVAKGPSRVLRVSIAGVEKELAG